MKIIDHRFNRYKAKWLPHSGAGGWGFRDGDVVNDVVVSVPCIFPHRDCKSKDACPHYSVLMKRRNGSIFHLCGWRVKLIKVMRKPNEIRRK